MSESSEPLRVAVVLTGDALAAFRSLARREREGAEESGEWVSDSEVVRRAIVRAAGGAR